MEENTVKKVIGIINKSFLPIHKRNSFWCPKVIKNKYYGFVLYLYGAHALDLYSTETGIVLKGFSKDYYEHFETNEIGEKIKRDLEAMKSLEEIETAIQNDAAPGMFNVLADACLKWAIKPRNPEYERMRQTRICADSKQCDDYFIFSMEEKFGAPEVDMLALGEVQGKLTLSFIEYKCTETATKGKISFKKHYEDMLTICGRKENLERAIALCNMRRKLLNKKVLNVNPEDISIQYILLVSNMLSGKINDNRKDTGKYVSSATVKRKLKEVQALPSFDHENVKVVFMKDFDIDVSATCTRSVYTLSDGIFKTMEEALQIP